MVLSKVCYLQVISPFLLYIVLYNDSDPEIAMKLRKHIQVSIVKNSACGSFYFGSYTLWKIGIVASPETSQNQVFWVKTSQLLHNRSKFSETKCVGQGKGFSIFFNSFFINSMNILCGTHSTRSLSRISHNSSRYAIFAITPFLRGSKQFHLEEFHKTH